MAVKYEVREQSSAMLSIVIQGGDGRVCASPKPSALGAAGSGGVSMGGSGTKY